MFSIMNVCTLICNDAGRFKLSSRTIEIHDRNNRQKICRQDDDTNLAPQAIDFLLSNFSFSSTFVFSLSSDSRLCTQLGF